MTDDLKKYPQIAQTRLRSGELRRGTLHRLVLQKKKEARGLGDFRNFKRQSGGFRA
jgi:hypothetical protein